ncbi:hypothetical protein F5144DRAFT_595880 [Chaetomium tenue]|uniref:Uncharacterized protein n=1 Tax=Chaetomium tenue TaxID=1854479 RepID=A0ACB7P2I8_9PEZI|nr:hypothetical protein F5144DRAFT_595880 [Chaetomium globosum]
MAWIKSMLKLESACRAPNRFAKSAVQTMGNHSSPDFEVRSSPGKGLGVFATKNIPRDSVIMRDPLVFRYEEGENLVERYRRFTMLPDTTQQDILKLAVQEDFKRGVAIALAVKGSMGGKVVDGIVTNIKRIREESEYEDSIIPRIMHLENVIATNAFGLHVDAASPGGLFVNASRLNHSCIPNADQAFDDNVGDMLSLDGWGFTCECPACDFGHHFSRARERYLRVLHHVCRDFCLDEAGRLTISGRLSHKMLEKAADRANKRIELFAEHHALRKFALRAYVARQHLGAFDIAILKYQRRRIQSDLDNALKFLKSIIKIEKIYYGKTSAITRAHEELYDRLQKPDIKRGSGCLLLILSSSRKSVFDPVGEGQWPRGECGS